jgi:hypothetical protein
MPALIELLRRLEGYDTYTSADALQAAMLELDNQSGNWHGGALADLWRSLLGQWQDQAGDQSWQIWSDWAERRLGNWHSFKTNALLSAFHHDPGVAQDHPNPEEAHRQRCEHLVRSVLFDLRQGIVDHPELVNDASVLQALARDGHAFSWRQAHKEILEDRQDFQLQPGDADLTLYCWVGSRAFRFLLTEADEVGGIG